MSRPLRTRIKICGITDLQAARAAVAAGADAIGLVFYEPSHRHLTLEQAFEIRASLPPLVDCVAVMVNPEPDDVVAMIQQVGPTLLQFQGEEPDDFCAGFGLPYLKGIRVSRTTDPAARERDYPHCQGILLDSFVPDQYGGSGHRFDWRRADYDGVKPLILAGGLDVDNVRYALEMVRPYGVDVSSSVETDGTKDSGKIMAFCRQVQAVDADMGSFPNSGG